MYLMQLRSGLIANTHAQTLENQFQIETQEVEQSAFSPGHLVPGIEPSLDKMLQGRLFSYPDTHKRRLGTNYTQIPINCPYRARVVNQQRDGPQSFNNQGNRPNYEPNSFQPLTVIPESKTSQFRVTGLIGRYKPAHPNEDYAQPGALFRKVMNDQQRTNLIDNVFKDDPFRIKNTKEERRRGFKALLYVVGKISPISLLYQDLRQQIQIEFIKRIFDHFKYLIMLKMEFAHYYLFILTFFFFYQRMKFIYGLTAASGFNPALVSIFSQNHYSKKQKSSTGILQLPAFMGLFQKVFFYLIQVLLEIDQNKMQLNSQQFYQLFEQHYQNLDSVAKQRFLTINT
ncbi:hypothetical protein pb186bvf_011200 [Paramecium bursaria]